MCDEMHRSEPAQGPAPRAAAAPQPPAAPPPSPEEYRCGPLWVCPARHLCKVGEETISLTRKEFDLLCLLLEHRGAILNRDDATLLCQGQRVELTKNEFRILQVLMENKGKTVSRETLMLRLWKTEDFVDENTLTVNIARLRKKLEEVGLQDFIVTKKGMGYLVE